MTTPPDVSLAPGADENGLANMLAALVRENIEAKPQKAVDFAGLHGNVAIVADDVDVALTLAFELGGKLTVHDGIVGVPLLTIRGPSDAIMALSNMPLATPLGLPIPNPKDREAVGAVRTVLAAMRQGKLHVHGAPFQMGLLMKLGRVMSVNG